ncbi:NADH-quinone oxidoreductase subunit C [bacterium]|nr:NADH-quinone oxidoreductase subunit C [bacterium]
MNIGEFWNIFEGAELVENRIILKDDLHKALQFALENYSFNLLKDITAVEKRDKSIDLTYHLYSVENDEDLLITINVWNEAESVIDLFKSAIADENEIYDMFGIKFIGNEYLKRLYMPESWEGFPLRKDYIQSDERLAWDDDNNV